MGYLRRQGSLAAFAEHEIALMEKVIDRAWDVIKQTDDLDPEEQTRELLAVCVLEEARQGEINETALLDRAISRFRTRRAMQISEARRHPRD